MNKSIILGTEYLDVAYSYAELAAVKHKSYGRDLQTIIKNICVGKMGEIAYCLMYDLLVSGINMSGLKGPDPGWDLIHDGFKIDVKTTETPLGRVYFNPDYAHCDRYAIITMNPVTGEFTHVLTMDKGLALRNSKCEDGRWFWDFGADLDSLKHLGYIAEIK